MEHHASTNHMLPLRGMQNHASLLKLPSGWWFGTFFIFPYIGNNHPNWLSYFSEGFKPPTSHNLTSNLPFLEPKSPSVTGVTVASHPFLGQRLASLILGSSSLSAGGGQQVENPLVQLGAQRAKLVYLVGGLEHSLFSHILGIIIPIDFHIFQRGWNHQPGLVNVWV